MKTKQSLSAYRSEQEIALKDIARVLQIDTANLSRMERGVREPSTRLFLLYHILFDDISIPQYFRKNYSQWITQIIQRTTLLTEELEKEQSPNAEYRVAYLKHILNRLSTLKHESEK